MIPVFRPLIDKDEVEASREALELGWLGMGSYVNEFEQAIRSFIGATDRYVAAVSTGHAALHLGLLVAGVGPGDEVITPSFNNITDFQAIVATGAEPVFCDIDNDTLCVDLDKAKEHGYIKDESRHRDGLRLCSLRPCACGRICFPIQTSGHSRCSACVRFEISRQDDWQLLRHLHVQFRPRQNHHLH